MMELESPEDTPEGLIFPTVCITLNKSNRLRLLSCPPELVSLLRQVILGTWGKVLSERNYHGAHEFVLRDSPWSCDCRNKDIGLSRRLIADILEVMAKSGWNLIQSTDVNRKQGAKDSLFFERGVPDPDASMFAVSLHHQGVLKVVAAQECEMVKEWIKRGVEATWPQGMESEEGYQIGRLNLWELKLKGNPWMPKHGDTVTSKMMICRIVSNMRCVGYKLYTSVDISPGEDGKDLDTWVFRKVTKCWE